MPEDSFSILESLVLCCFWTTQTLGLINLPPSRQTQSTSINATVTFPLFKRKAHKLVPVLSQMLRVWPGRKISVKSSCLFFCGGGGVWGVGGVALFVGMSHGLVSLEFYASIEH